MEYDERLAQFRQTRLNPFDRGEEDGQPGGQETPPQNGNVCKSSTRSAAPETASSSLCSLSGNASIYRYQLSSYWQEQEGDGEAQQHLDLMSHEPLKTPWLTRLLGAQSLAVERSAQIAAFSSYSTFFLSKASLLQHWLLFRELIGIPLSQAGSKHPKVYAVERSWWRRDTLLFLTFLWLNTWMLRSEMFPETSASTFSLTASVCVSSNTATVFFPVAVSDLDTRYTAFAQTGWSVLLWNGAAPT